MVLLTFYVRYRCISTSAARQICLDNHGFGRKNRCKLGGNWAEFLYFEMKGFSRTEMTEMAPLTGFIADDVELEFCTSVTADVLLRIIIQKQISTLKVVQVLPVVMDTVGTRHRDTFDRFESFPFLHRDLAHGLVNNCLLLAAISCCHIQPFPLPVLADNHISSRSSGEKE